MKNAPGIVPTHLQNPQEKTRASVTTGLTNTKVEIVIETGTGTEIERIIATVITIEVIKKIKKDKFIKKFFIIVV